MSLETATTRPSVPAPPHLPTPQSTLLAFACHIVLPDLLLLTRILEKSVAVGTTFGLLFENDELCIQTIMAQDQLGFDACVSQLAFLPGTSSSSVYRHFTTKQRRAAVLGFLRDHIPTNTTPATPAVASPTTQQPVMISWLDNSGRIAIHVHPPDCPQHVHGQPIEDWSAHLIKVCQVVPEGHRISPYVAHFEPINDKHEPIVSTRSMERVRGMPVALRFASSQELSNQARDAALLTVGPIVLQWKPEQLSFFGIGASAVVASEVNCFRHATAEDALDFFTTMPSRSYAPTHVALAAAALPTTSASGQVAAVVGPKVEDCHYAPLHSNPVGGGGGGDAEVEDDEPQVEYASCSLKVAKAHSMVSPTLLHIAAKVLSTQANEPTSPAFLWLPGHSSQPVIFGGTMCGVPQVRWFIHIESCQANSLEFCPGIVWRDRPDLQADLACLLPPPSPAKVTVSSLS